MACGLAAGNMTDDELKALSELLDQHQQQKSVQEGTGYYQESKDFDFHFRIVKGSRNARLVQMLCEDLYYLLRVYRYKSSTKPGRAKQALREHKDIVAALMRRDPVEAERKMRLHIGNARLYVEEQMQGSGQPAGGRAAAAVRKPKTTTACCPARTARLLQSGAQVVPRTPGRRHALAVIDRLRRCGMPSGVTDVMIDESSASYSW